MEKQFELNTYPSRRGNKISLLTLALCALTTIAFTSSAFADDIPATLTPGNTVSVPNYYLGSPSSVIVDSVNTFAGSGGADPVGDFITLAETSSYNPFGADDLAFAYDVIVTSGDVVDVSISGFSGFETAIHGETVTPTGTYIAETDASLSANGDAITVDFTGIPGGPWIVLPNGLLEQNPAYSASFVIYTNAPSYTDPTVTITDIDGNSVQTETVGPSVTPEPSSFMLLGSGLVGFAGMVRRKLKA